MPATLSRRSFFNILNPAAAGGNPSKGKRPFAPLSDPLAPFVPDANTPWNENLAGHLLRRTMMSPTWSDIEALVALDGPGPAVDLLLSATSTPAAPNAASDATLDPSTISNVTLQNQLYGQLNSDAAALREWWEGLHAAASNSIQEKMTAFWSGHFTSAFDLGNSVYDIAPLLYIQNQLFRANALGNFQDLVKAVTLDGAMLVYLGGNQNTAGAPNENYARELMELFTCGLNGGYTEADVQAGARILTGWRVAEFSQEPDPNGIFQTYFDPGSHDTGDKTYLETDFPAIDTSSNTAALVQANEIDKMIETLFTQTGTSIATFICTKIYQFFIYSDTDTSDATEQTVISELASVFMQNNWEIKPVISTLLKSQHFFDNNNIGCQIKTPAEYVIGLSRQLAPASIDANMTNDGEQFFQPPNVSGWPGYHDWLTTNTYPLRGTQAQAVIQSISDGGMLTFIQQFPNYNSDVVGLSTAIGQLLLPRPLAAARLQTFWQTLLGTQTNDGEWPTLLTSSPATAENNIRNLLNYIIALPDFELC